MSALLFAAACGSSVVDSDTVEPHSHPSAHTATGDPMGDQGPRDDESGDSDEEWTETPVDPGPASPSDSPAPSTLAEPMATIVAAHNRYRAAHCAAPLTWSPKIAAVAQRWADTLRDRNCAFDHSRGSYGENLAAGSTGALTAQGVVDMWYREVDLYNWNQQGFSMKSGHFTQVVWRGTRSIGCGVSQCNGMDVWVCNYDPPGNMQSAFDANVKPTGCR